mgnify:CR=1 FL=1
MNEELKVAEHFGYETTERGGKIFVAKINQCFKVWLPFNRQTHPKEFAEYEQMIRGYR